jgi:hypothetical protein
MLLCILKHLTWIKAAYFSNIYSHMQFGHPRLYWDDLLKALLGNGSLNTPATHVHATIGRSSLGNGEVYTPGILGNGVFDAVPAIATWCNNRTGKVFSVRSVPRCYKHDSVKQREVAVSHSGVTAESSWGFVNCCNQMYKGQINSIIKSKTRLLSHANPWYVTIWCYSPLTSAEVKKMYIYIPTLPCAFLAYCLIS